ncbi:MAG: uracil-DNA glycosylase [Thermogemmata sp.]|nr:uracil-DNA glycosylase [Thermogemmata sp.]
MTAVLPALTLPADLDPGWRDLLEVQSRQPYWVQLQTFLQSEWRQHTVYPPAADIFTAFRYTPLAQVRVVLVGQDPYPGAGQAHGLAFSVRPGVPLPASLRNIFRELHSDLGIAPAAHGCLVPWARQGVLLLNACLTVRAGQPLSHTGRGWEQFTHAVLTLLNQLPRRLVFLLWGQAAQKTAACIDPHRHVLLTAAHPSPLSAHHGFFGSRPFSRTNAALQHSGSPPIDWQLPPLVPQD